ncbi:MAG: carboxypeptidase-like regulatory domain-containing protein [Chitinophagales bacterium]|nr:carboxypeptidase-like regulatory domain-containing protein [Bacteroidota bacterium]MCB9043218.1 carboxypeptidase-like regulatory domain-containing protein [Chitinophagales bacterium]
MKKFLFFVILCFASVSAFAQSGEITGKVTDAETGEAVPFASVFIELNGLPVGATTDLDGFYSIKPVPPGSYTLTVSFVGYQTSTTTGVLVSTDKITYYDVVMEEGGINLDEIVIKEYTVPLFEADNTTSQSTVTKEDIANLPTRNVESIASNTAGVYQSDEGASLNIKGGRSESTEYIIDGIRVRGGTALPANAIEQMSVVTGGLPAKYGDATGGIINITTRGGATEFGGGVEFITSELTDNYGYNHITGTLTGPIIKRKIDDKLSESVLAFFLAGEFITEKDDMPSTLGIYKIKDEVYNEITQNPLLPSKTGTGFDLAHNFVTKEDLDFQKVRSNVEKTEVNGTAKFDLSLFKGGNLTLGGSTNYVSGGLAERSGGYRDFVRRYEVFDSEHSPYSRDFTYRGFLRFTHSLNSRLDENDEEPTFSNIFYSVQFDYTKDKVLWQDPIHEDRFFDYGYVGSFSTSLTDIYNQGSITAYSNVDNKPITLSGRVYAGVSPDGVAYTPGDLNPIAARITQQYYELADDNTTYYNNIFDIQNGGGLLNGSRTISASTIYSLYYAPGKVWDDYLKDENDQVRISFNGSADLKKKGSADRNKHALEFGAEYEQRKDREYRIAPEALWDRMRREMSQPGGNNITLDLDNPILLIDGQRIALADYNPSIHGTFGAYDTITYNYVAAPGSKINDEIRALLGVGPTDWVSTDALDPRQLSLDMFSPEDLWGSGTTGDNLLSSYYGYDYLGNKISGKQPSFEEFFERDDNERVKGVIGAFQPIYMAGYIQDKFSFKDLIFNVGVRIDRYDANQKVMKDPYSLYGVRTAGEITEFNGLAYERPSTVGEDYVPYVDDVDNPTRIMGYRYGDNWYDANGIFINDPRVLESGGDVIPYLVNPNDDIQDPDFVISSAFEDYTPSITVMPRLAFSFPISDEAIFYAHYNVLAQRPQGNNFMTPFEYYFFTTRAIGRYFPNPNLKPEKTVDYQVGFKQKLGGSSAMSLAFFYREMRDMVQLVNLTYAYPIAYNTYGNVDFGTVKGMEFTYDLRRTGNIKLVSSYTLQFASGSGSSTTSGANLVDNGLPNLRTIFPLSYDARHTINLTIDYRYGEGKKYNGPTIGGLPIFANAGANFIIRYRTGTPYSQQQNATPEAQFGIPTRPALEGKPYGSRLPGAFKVDMKIDKDFKIGGKDNNNAKYFNVYLWVQNLLDAENVLRVYDYTGNGHDDGYLADPASASVINSQLDPASFIDLYSIKVDNPYNFILPRRARVGVSFNF